MEEAIRIWRQVYDKNFYNNKYVIMYIYLYIGRIADNFEPFSSSNLFQGNYNFKQPSVESLIYLFEYNNEEKKNAQQLTKANCFYISLICILQEYINKFSAIFCYEYLKNFKIWNYLLKSITWASSIFSNFNIYLYFF